MSGIELKTRAGSLHTFSDQGIAELKERLRGQLLTPRERGYDACRTIWNAMHDLRPSLIVRCAGTADVIAAVNFARKRA